MPRRLLLPLVFLLLALPAWSGPDVAGFIEGVGRWTAEGDLYKVVQAVRLHSEVAAPAFDRVLERFRATTSAEDLTWLNAVARAFFLEGRAEPTEELRRLGVLWPESSWAGTLFEADQPVHTRGQVARTVPGSPEPPSPASEARAILALAVRTGDEENAARALEALAGLGAVDDGARVLGIVRLEGAGLWSQALDQGLPLLGSLRDPAAKLHLALALLNAARRSSQPALQDRFLDLAAPLADGAEGDRGRAARFLVRSFRFSREWERDPGLDFGRLVARHQEAWEALGEVDPTGLDPGTGRWITEAAAFWVSLALDRMNREVEEYPLYAQAAYMAEEDLHRLRTLARRAFDRRVHPSTFGQMLRLWNPEPVYGALEARLRAVEAWRLNDRPRRAKELLDEVTEDFARLEESRRELSLTYQLAALKPAGFGELSLGGVTFDSSVFGHGEFYRVGALFHLEKARLLIPGEGREPSPEDLGLLKEALDRARSLQREARTAGWLGPDDARWETVAFLFRLRPPGWPAEARVLVDGLSAAAERSGDREAGIRALTASGELALLDGRPDEARKALTRAVEWTEQHLVEVGGGEAGSEALRRRHRRAYELLARLHLEGGRPAEAFTTLARLGEVERAASLDLEAVAARRPEAREDLARLRDLRRRTRALEAEASSLPGAAPKEVEGLLARTRSEFYTTLGDLRRRYPEYSTYLAVRPVNFSRIQPLVPKDAVVVQIFPADDSLFLFVLTSRDLKIRRVPVGRAELDALVATALRSLSREPAGPLGPADPLALALTTLHRHLLDPLEDDLREAKVVAFIPAGNLIYLPFQALAREREGRLEFLAERKQVVTLLKSTDLEGLGRARPGRKDGLVALGDPDGSLPAAAEEARQVAALFSPSSVFVGPEATRERLSRAGEARYVHLATHGVLNRRDPNASYLVLSGQGRLGIPDIADLDLAATRLVTLSACQTALGEGAGASSELTTLADAFGFAGCPSVVASLWKVSDESTRLLMVRFYEELRQGKPLAEALQEAQVSLIRRDATAHPFHWAPFVLLGDWR